MLLYYLQSDLKVTNKQECRER